MGAFAGTAKFNVQFQLDLVGSTTTAVTEYFLNIDLWHWVG